MGYFLNTGVQAPQTGAFAPKLGAWSFEIRQGDVASAIVKVQIVMKEAPSIFEIYGGKLVDIEGNNPVSKQNLLAGTNSFYLRVDDVNGGMVQITNSKNISTLGLTAASTSGMFFDHSVGSSAKPYYIINLETLPTTIRSSYLSGAHVINGDIGKWSNRVSLDVKSLFMTGSYRPCNIYGSLAHLPAGFVNLYISQHIVENPKSLLINLSAFSGMDPVGNLVVGDSMTNTSISGSLADFKGKQLTIGKYSKLNLTGSLGNLPKYLQVIRIQSLCDSLTDLENLVKDTPDLSTIVLDGCTKLVYPSGGTAWAGNLSQIDISGTVFNAQDTEQILKDLNNSKFRTPNYGVKLSTNEALTTTANNAIAGLAAKGVVVTIYNK